MPINVHQVQHFVTIFDGQHRNFLEIANITPANAPIIPAPYASTYSPCEVKLPSHERQSGMILPFPHNGVIAIGKDRPLFG
jgi:hypothetical protein